MHSLQLLHFLCVFLLLWLVSRHSLNHQRCQNSHLEKIKNADIKFSVHDATLEQPSSKSNTLFWNNLHQSQIRYSGTTFIKVKYVILEQPSSKSNTLFWNNLHQSQIRYSGTTFIKVKYFFLEQPSWKSNTLFWNNLHQS
jgi:hypothetical protein